MTNGDTKEKIYCNRFGFQIPFSHCIRYCGKQCKPYRERFIEIKEEEEATKLKVE